MNRKLSLVAAAAVLTAFSIQSAGAEVHEFSVDPVHSQVGFKIRHLMGKTPGSFNDFSGTVTVDPENVASTLQIQGTIRTASIDTNNEKRDGHLKSADFFDAESHPEITFVSKSVQEDGKNVMVLADLTMHGVTQEVRLKADLVGVMTNPFTGTPTLGLDLAGSVDRKEFGILWNKTLDAGGLMLGDEVQIEVHLEATVPPAAPAES
jgi:polyisoprenoid-binding protein YceI